MTKATKLTPVWDIAMSIRAEKKIDFDVNTAESIPQHNHYEGYTNIALEGAYEWGNGEKILSISEITGNRVDEEGNPEEEADTLDYWWVTYYPADSTPENPSRPEYDDEGGAGSAEELKSIIVAHMQTITAKILDTGTTEGYLVVELPEGEFVRAELTDDMEDTADAVPDLAKALEKAGYRFKGQPTDDEGDVLLERI